MASPQLDDQVVLQHDIPELSLRSGDVGVVRGSVSEPTVAYEVEFRPGLGPGTLALLTAAEFEVRPSTRGREKEGQKPGETPSTPSGQTFVRCRRCGAVTENTTAGLCPSCLVIAAAAALPGSAIVDPAGLTVESQPSSGVTLLPDWERPEQIGPYRILETLGEGSMGVVYKAEQRQPVRRLVALKVVKLGMDTKEVIARFEAERQALAMMNHPNVARVYDAGVTERGTPYFVMEHVPGEPITAYCDIHRLSIRQRLHLFVQACDAVQHAHHKAIIHRDIKPSNVLVTEEEGEPVVKVIDFGIAKALNQRLTDHTVYTEQGRLMGTPEYMSPEQAELTAIDVDTRTDVYSLGVLLYELLGGALPFDSKMLRTGGHEALRRIIGQQEPARPSERIATADDQAKLNAQLRGADCPTLARLLRSELEWIPLKAMRKDRAERYRSASQLADDVENYLAGRPLLAGPPTTTYRIRKFVRQHFAAVTSAVTALAVILGLVIALAFTTRHALRASASQALLRHEADAARGIAEQRAREAEEQRAKAKAAAQLADQRLADGLMSAGDSLTKSSQLGDARRCYAEALDIYRKLGTSSTAALAGLMIAGGDQTPLMGPYGAKAGVGGFAGHTGNVTHVVLTRDGRRAVTAGEDHTLILWDVATGVKIREFRGHKEGVTYVALAPDERTILSTSDDKSLIWWNLETGSKIGELDGHTNQVWVVAFSPDGSYAASGGMDRSIRIWDLSTGRTVHLIKAGPTDDDDPAEVRREGRNPDGHQGAVAALVFMPDGKRILSGSQDGMMKMWDLQDERLLARYKAHTDSVNCIALAPPPDGTHVVTGSFDKTLLLWDLARTTPIKKFEGHTGWVWRVAFSSNGRRIASASRDGTAKIWDVDTGKELRSIAVQTENVMSTAFLPDDRFLLTTRGPGVGNDWPQDEGTMALWDAAPDNGILGQATLLSAVTCASISDERLVLLGTADGAAMLWDATTHLKLRTLAAHPGGVRAVSLSPDGKWALTAGEDGLAVVWDMATGRPTRTLRGHAGPVTAVALLPGGRYALSGGKDATLRMWDIQSGDQPRAFPPQKSPVTSLSVSPDGLRALTGATDGSLSLWNLSTAEVRTWAGHVGAANCVALSPVDDIALSGGDDSLLMLWDLKTGHPIRVFPKQSDRVTQVAFSPDGMTALSGTADGTITLWDLKTGLAIQSFARHSDAVTALAFTSDGTCAVSASKDKTVKLLDFGRALQYRQFEIRVPQAREALAKSPDNAQALLTFGEWYAFRGKDDWAVEFLTHAREKGASVSPLVLARCYCRLNIPKAARAEFRDAISQRQISELYAFLSLQATSPTTRPAQ